MTTNRDPTDTLVVRRLIPVPREQVFAAWLDPASLAQWMRPGDDLTRATAEVDARLGGKMVDAHREGWTEILRRLDALLVSSHG
jgi:uncharacterized protein YndB with AHSA1/START domain